MKFFSDMIINFFIRMVIGVAMIFLINQFLASEGIVESVGINSVTMITSGTLGVPGVCMLYGMVFYQGF